MVYACTYRLAHTVYHNTWTLRPYVEVIIPYEASRCKLVVINPRHASSLLCQRTCFRSITSLSGNVYKKRQKIEWVVLIMWGPTPWAVYAHGHMTVQFSRQRMCMFVCSCLLYSIHFAQFELEQLFGNRAAGVRPTQRDTLWNHVD